ncbi:MAG TPA: ATP-binding protein [Solirubrobacteraceae bacterium]|jgi:PAS domain S-box-containing protein|nr:ATP-binding protein [Solirubrobacteraceae bacterium]
MKATRPWGDAGGPRQRESGQPPQPAASATQWGELPHRLLFERNPQPIIVYERPSLRILAVSDGAVAAYDYSREEFASLTIRDLVAHEGLDAWDGFQEQWLALDAPGLFTGPPRQHRRKDGVVIGVQVMGDDLMIDGMACRLLVCQVVSDHDHALADLEHAREQLRVGEERYRLLFESNPQPMVVYDRETLRLVDVNDAMMRKYGYSREELLAMTGLDLLVAEDVPSVTTHLARDPGVTEPGAGPKGWRHQLKDGTVIDVETASDNVTINGRPCRLTLFEDVTERKRAAEALAAAHEKAVETSNLKSAFLANMSHEIRTPMNGVIGLAELLMETNLDGDQRELTEQLVLAGGQLLALISDILDISKIEAGRLELDPTDFDLHETIEQACAATAVAVRDKRVGLERAIDASVPRHVHGDGVRFRQVLTNLLSNASKFTAEGRITVSASGTEEADATRVRVSVADTGIGIDPAVLAGLFEPFTQADSSTTRKYGGTGLGLAIVGELVTMMGGVSGATSEPGAGSTFWFELPFARRAEPARTDEPSEQRTSLAAADRLENAPLVLVAEDAPVNQIVAVRTLERCGYRADVVNNGREALDALEQTHYDAVLMDCQMPVLDGYAATTELRRRERTSGAHIPVIAITAHALAGDRERCLDAGMDDYVTKPIRSTQLAETLAKWIPAKTPSSAPARERAAVPSSGA